MSASELSSITYNYSNKFEFERVWDEPAFNEYLNRRLMDPLLYSLLYAVIIFSIKYYMRNREEYDLRQPLAVWSTGLAVFSIAGVVRTVPEFLFAVNEQSFQYSVCMPTWYNGVAGFWGGLFVTSKVCELGDTLFIVLRKKPLVFLHWYHHITVLCYCWYSFSQHTAAGRWFMVMNFTVHSFMYSYYALKAMQIYVPKQISLLITSMQLLQMIMGCIINIMVFVYKSRGEFCQQSDINLVLSTAMYFSYFVLFANFFYKTYMVPRSKSRKQHKSD
ncbi:hypothetical protein LOTGIDRAFT_210968 [Lottia gigantea]|uniref:Elongation of very long chain fatty acids protein n=1 Tax=Lottia gigantea TaxID=225164 RepID=V3Z0L4_LOTGI|nr:hypothetical protein LOTGIDRAFT_210968 [Lottia gigantea]ESO84018.1 hypothetical protein LOTGIDRAFT_210968 [Lottia gigantea]